MEYLKLQKTDRGMVLTDFPNAACLIRLAGRNAQRLADMWLHLQDLDFARECIEAINSCSGFVTRQALWRSAIVHFQKCFGQNNARPSSLTAKSVYKNDPEGLRIYRHFKNLRDKHVVHDENALTQCHPAAVVLHQLSPYKIEKIVCLSASIETLDQEAFSNLSLLIGKAREWATSEFDRLCESITRELEEESYEELVGRPQVEYSLPKTDDIHRARR